jgi:hypothetical protein
VLAAELCHDDTLEVGAVRLRFRDLPAPAPAPPAPRTPAQADAAATLEALRRLSDTLPPR